MTVYTPQTGIVFQVRVRFAGAKPRKQSLDCGLWLTRPAEHPCLLRIETLGIPGFFWHHFRLTKLPDLDRRLAALVREAYAVGRQEHLRPRAKRGVRGEAATSA